MKDSNMPRADFLTAIVLIVFGITVLLISIGMPRFEELNVNPYSVPGIVPGFLGSIFAVLGVTLLIRSVIQKGYRFELTSSGLRNWLRDDSTRRLLLTLGLCIFYALVLVGLLPYAIGTIIFIFAFIVLFEYRRGVSPAQQKRMFLIAALISVISGLGIWAVFRYVFLVSLP
jgi:putative tricarboxylic transport membrane protein